MFLPARVLSPLLCLRRPPHLLSPVLPGFLIAVKEQFKTEEVYLFNSISVFPCWVRDTGGTGIYIHLPLSHEIIYLRNLFPEPCALSFTAVVYISEPARDCHERKKTNMKCAVMVPPQKFGKI